MARAQRWKLRPLQTLLSASIGTRLFMIMLIALLPLAIIDVIASHRISQIAQSERQRMLAQNVEDSAKRMALALNRDVRVIQTAATRIAVGENPGLICARLRQVLDSRNTRPMVLVYADSGGKPTCRYGPIGPDLAKLMTDGDPADAIISKNPPGVMLRVKGQVNLATAVLFYTPETLYKMADPVDEMAVSQFTLSRNAMTLPLSEVPDRWAGRMTSKLTAKDMLLGEDAIWGLSFNLLYQKPKASSPEFLALILPFLIITAASVIVWLVANRMLIDPMQRLQSKMRRYQTGELIAPMRRDVLNASEIEELDQAFFGLTEKVAVDKHALDQGLAEQIRLTREVHHRVKNNLQIIASLISLHSRIAETPQALEAYTKIQRRVDALSVVQRNHYAGSEQTRGIDLNALVSELAGSFQAIGDDDNSQPIHVMIDNVRVDQDIAVPVAFLLTELLDLIQQVDDSAEITIDTKPINDKADKLLLTISSRPLGPSAHLDGLLKGGIDRVLTGLARQLRTPLDRDLDLATMCVEIPKFKPRIEAG